MLETFERLESTIRGYSRAWPAVFERASGSRIHGEDGREWIDFFAGAGVLNFGHSNPLMKAAVLRFIEEDGMVHSLDMATVPKRAFLEAFADTILAPRGMDHRMQFMGPTGTNAVEAALKLARRVTGRRTVVAFSHGFHGMTLGALACTANAQFRNAAGVPLEHVVRLPFEGMPGGSLEDLNALRGLWEDSSSGLEAPAAVLLEPLQAEGGVNVASREWLQGVDRFARAQGALLVLDDIQAGCGRTGSYFSFDGMGLTPDIVCLAKGLGGYGTPIAMNLVRPEHDAHWSPGEHTGTFRGQGISFVAGREALRYFEDDVLMSRVREQGERMRTALENMADRAAGHAFEVRGRGMMQGLDMVDGALARRASALAFERGLMVGPCGTGGRVIKLIPPLTIDQKDLEEGLAILAECVADAVQEVV